MNDKNCRYGSNYKDFIHILVCVYLWISRAGAGNGAWVLCLLPISIIASAMRHPIILTPTYKLISLCCIGFLTTSLIIAYKTYKMQVIKALNIWTLLNAALTTFIIHIYFWKGGELHKIIIYLYKYCLFRLVICAY